MLGREPMAGSRARASTNQGVVAEMTEQTADHTQETSKSQGPAIESRFMFVDVAALRAKQLRRGALARVTLDHHEATHKLERVAMEEVRRGLIDYSLPEPKKPGQPDANA